MTTGGFMKTEGFHKQTRILVVDDDRSICYTLERALSEKGHSVDYTLSGSEALKSLKESKYDVLFLDLLMPDMDGVEVLKNVKKHFPQVEVITISGMGSMRTALGTLSMDAFDFLSKPIHLSSLFNVLERLKQKKPEFPLSLE